MSDALNEFAINLPMTGVSAVAPVAGSVEAAPAPAMEPAIASYDCTMDVPVPADVQTEEHKHINVYVDSASVVNVEGPCAFVDLVMSVNITNPVTYACAQYKIVKRLSMDKIKLALQAEHMTPFQVVEAEEPEDDALLVEQEDQRFAAAKRAQEIAGIFTESKGDKTFKVMIKYDDPSGSGIASATITVDAVKDAAHARHVVKSKHLGKYKNAKIVRATEVKKEA